MKVITISGPGAVGKDTIIKELLLRLQNDFPGQVSRAAYHATRKLRNNEVEGEGIKTCSNEEFDRLVNEGQIPFVGKLVGYRVGYTVSEMQKSEIVLTNIFIDFANQWHDILQKEGNQVLRFYIDAPNKELMHRSLARGETFPIINNLERRMEIDRERDTSEQIARAEYYLENKEGQLEQTLNVMETRIKEFINGETKA